jgi:hypothetical protein
MAAGTDRSPDQDHVEVEDLLVNSPVVLAMALAERLRAKGPIGAVHNL